MARTRTPKGAAGSTRIEPPVGRVIPALPISLQLQRIGGGVTPAQVSEILRLADLGYMYRLVDLANDARQKDCHLQSVLGTRENALAGLKWQIVCPDNSRLKERKAAEFCEKALRNTPDFAHLVSHLTGGAFYGYAVAETIWEYSGELVPVEFQRISPRRFVFETTQGRLQWWDQSGSQIPYPGVDLAAEYPGKFITHQPRITGDVPCREGLVRVLMWAALFRNWDLRDWLTLAELAWKPWRTGKYQKAASAEDKNNLMAILEGMSSSGVAIYPETTEVQVLWPARSGSGKAAHAELFQTMGSEMSKAVLGQTLTTEQGAVGSQALGKVHNEVRKDILEADALSVAATIRRDLLAPMVRFNFGDNVRVPDFRFMTDAKRDLVTFSQGVSTLTAIGVKVPVRWIREEAGIPEPDEDDETIGAGGEEPGEDGEDLGPKDPIDPNEPDPEGEPQEDEDGEPLGGD